MALDTLGSPDLQIEEQMLAQKQKLAEILAERGMQPIQVPANTRISPFQGMAQMANAYAGRKMQQEVETGQRALGERANTRLAEGVQDYFKTKYGSGVTPDPQEFSQAADGMSPPPAPATGNPRAAMTQALMSRNPLLQKIGALDMSHQNEIDKPREVNAGAVMHYPGGEHPDLAVKPQHDKSIPANWASAVPPGASRQPNDPPGVFRMKGVEGIEEPYYVAFEDGKPTSYHKLDNATVRNVGAGGTPYFSPVSTAQGVFKFDHRTGRMALAPVEGGGPTPVRETADPALAGAKEAERQAGHVRGQLTETQRLQLPKAIDTANNALKTLDQMVGNTETGAKPHPGFSSYVGFTWRPGARLIHGTPEADFESKLKQHTGGAFLQAYETLKGGGQITEIEGQKGTEAISRMKSATSEKEFMSAADDFRQVIKQGLERAKIMAAQAPAGGRAAAAPPPPAGFVVNQ